MDGSILDVMYFAIVIIKLSIIIFTLKLGVYHMGCNCGNKSKQQKLQQQAKRNLRNRAPVKTYVDTVKQNQKNVGK